MDDVCIVCSRSIELPDLPPDPSPDDPAACNAADSALSTRTKSSASIASNKSNGSNGHTRQVVNGKGRSHGPHGVKIKRNHSSTRLAGRGKSAMKALTAANPTPLEGKDDDIAYEEEEDCSGDHHSTSAHPEWMSLYCSEECRKEDELRSRMAVTNLYNEQQRFIGTSSSSPPQHPSVSPVRRSSAWPHYTPSSPLATESEGSEYDWAGAPHVRPRQAGSNSRGRVEADSRRLSDGSDSSRLSAVSRSRRSSSKMRDSSDSLSSLQDHSERPELSHRPSSMRHTSLRAMTPIHLDSAASSRDPSPRSLIVRPVTTSAAMQRSSSDTSHQLGSTATAMPIPTSSAHTFRPHSLGKGGLKPSKSSATLAMTSGSDIKATLANDPLQEGDYFTAETYQPTRHLPHRLSSSVPRHRSHPSHSSIPYLSCSPSSPGSGSLHSARSIASTAASSSSARGELEQQQVDSYRKAQHVDERERTGSLTNYGLFHQRSPSTPSLHTMQSYGRGGMYGTSPGGRSSSARLGSSYEQHSGSGTISQVFRNQRMSRNSLSAASAGPASPRRVSFDYLNDPRYNGPSHVSDPTPTASGSTTRASSFVSSLKATGPLHEVVHLSADIAGRARAPSITRTHLERVPSDRSVTSLTKVSSTSGLRPLLPRRHTSHSDASASSPPSPALSTPGQFYQRQPSHPSINQLPLEDYSLSTAKPFGHQHRSKSRSSFTWDHLPSYVPTYQAMDIDKVKRNKSGTSLHSVSEQDIGGTGDARREDYQATVKKSSAGQPKKRLFYFPDES